MQPDVLFRAAADQAPQVMWIVNTKGAVTYLNQAWYRLVGGEPPKWYGHEWAEVVLEEDVDQMRRGWRDASAGGNMFEGTRRVKAADGSLHVLSYKATPVHDGQGVVTCWVGMDADITELVASQSALRFANQELQGFAHTVSHDLRSPLVTVQGFATMLSRHLGTSADTKTTHYIERISLGIDHMARLVDGLLALSHVARSDLVTQEVDLSKLAARILDAHKAREPGRRVRIDVQPAMVAQADGPLMAVLLENLLGNAWKFTSRVAHPAIAMEAVRQVTGEQAFVVRDNGDGFDMAHAGQLFVPFQRLHRYDEFPGTGIGLATAQRIAERHGGRVWAQSVPGKGTSMFFSVGGS